MFVFCQMSSQSHCNCSWEVHCGGWTISVDWAAELTDLSICMSDQQPSHNNTACMCFCPCVHSYQHQHLLFCVPSCSTIILFAFVFMCIQFACKTQASYTSHVFFNTLKTIKRPALTKKAVSMPWPDSLCTHLPTQCHNQWKKTCYKHVLYVLVGWSPVTSHEN